MKMSISIVLALTLCMVADVAKADFTFGTPTNLGPIVNSENTDFTLSISNDELSLFFCSTRLPGSFQDFDLWMATRSVKDEEWNTPVHLGDIINSRGMEWTPCISSDGLELYFGGGTWGNTDISVTKRDSITEPWGPVENLGPTVNSPAWDSGPSITKDGLELFFSSTRAGGFGGPDLYVTTRTSKSDSWGPAKNLGPIVNSSYGSALYGEWNPNISNDGLILFFASARPPGSASNLDIWMTTRTTRESEWRQPERLPINSSSHDASPSISADGLTLYFSSERPGGSGGSDFWQVPISSVFKAHNPYPANGSFYEDAWASLRWSSGHTAISYDLYFGDNFEDVKNGASNTFRGNQSPTSYVVGIVGFPFPDGLIPGTIYYWRIDAIESDGKIHEGNVWSFTIPSKKGYNPIPADGTYFIGIDTELSWTEGLGAKLHYVYFGDNFDNVKNAAEGLPQGNTIYAPTELEFAKTYFWRVDEFDGIETYKGNIWSFTTEGTVSNPNPAQYAVDVMQIPTLTWIPGFFADSHEIYFGTDPDAVKNATKDSTEFKGRGNFGSESYEPGQLEWNTTYYWRIDEVNNTNTNSPWKGPVWNFTTANFLIVDDFESYNDLDPDNPKSKRIFDIWIDGFNTPANGSQVGDLWPSYTPIVVHTGRQSLPFYYDNSVAASYSEATMTLTYPRDWTENNVGVLSLWFYGDMNNAPEKMYIALNGSAMTYYNNPDALLMEEWTEWTVDLQVFQDQGVNLTNVNRITIGFGEKNGQPSGNSGHMNFDDIRLYQPNQQELEP